VRSIITIDFLYGGLRRRKSRVEFNLQLAGDDNVPSNVPRTASRISFESSPRIKSFPREMKKIQTALTRISRIDAN